MPEVAAPGLLMRAEEERILRNFRDLEVWEKASQLTLEIYGATANFPVEDFQTISGPIRRTCAFIASNIAEGCSKKTNREFYEYLRMAMSLALNLEKLLFQAHERRFLENAELERLSTQLDELKGLLNLLIEN